MGKKKPRRTPAGKMADAGAFFKEAAKAGSVAPTIAPATEAPPAAPTPAASKTAAAPAPAHLAAAPAPAAAQAAAPVAAPQEAAATASASSAAPEAPLLVCTTTAGDNLEVLRRSLSVHRCVLLSGGVGTGKTTMCRFLASEQNVEMISVGLDSSVDIKDLVGTFRSTAPGRFDFQLGPLAMCAQAGKWLLLEDLDLASGDVTSALVSLLQTGELYIPEQDRTITCAPTFRLLATVQTSGTGGVGGRKGTLPHVQLWGVVSVLPQSMLEMFQCVATACPSVNHTLLHSVKTTFETLYSVAQAEKGDDDAVLDQCPEISFNEVRRLLPHVRLSLRELLRWGRRMMMRAAQCTSTDFIDVATKDIMYLEALDSFCRHLPESKGYSTMAKTIGAGLGVTSEKQDFLLHHHRAQVTATDGHFAVGRQVLEVNQAVGQSLRGDPNFGDTKAALGLLERLAVCVKMVEPVLLTGETGVGKTYIVQHLATQLNQQLVVHNLNQQSETSDIIGGYKPADISARGVGFSEKAAALVEATYPPDVKIQSVLQQMAEYACSKKWASLTKLVKKVSAKPIASLEKKIASGAGMESGGKHGKLLHKWTQIVEEADLLEKKAKEMKSDAAKGAFEFVEGSLVSCFREGHWLLLDEINLADTEILERISQTVELVHHVSGDQVTATASLTITEKGGEEGAATIHMHPNFRLFACMNPPTDVGKKDLPPSLKSRFTELYCDELTDKADLRVVVSRLIGSLVPHAPVDEVVDYYLACREHSATKLTDNDPATPKPHYSLRTLTRALRFTRQVVATYGFEAALLEGVYLCFYSQLSRPFQLVMNTFVSQYLLRGKNAPLVQPPQCPPQGQHVQFEHFWLELGSLGAPDEITNYIVTQSVGDHLRNLARIVVAGRAVLLQGPTSAGKTSMVEYLARVTGHQCIRINNHETTDLQEYVGQYVSDKSRALRFVEGPLVTACREGHWIILDELNLAPSEVLEALNRLLDDNRELFIPETMETVKPHPHFRLFATQNPPGLYGGRKQLSRAMRNRFMEILVDDIPHKELVEILHKRYKMAPSMAEKMVEVMTTLQTRRQNSAIFQGKHGFITPRDLFRWAERGPFTWEELATHGMFLLGDRCRKPEEAKVVKTVLQDVLKTSIPDDDICYDPKSYPQLAEYWERFEALMKGEGELPPSLGGGKIVATKEFKRLFVLVGLCLRHSEPFVLVGETGGGKTTVCQLWGFLLGQELTVVNCHQHSETADFLGAFRPSPPKERESGELFKWMNGPLIECMQEGQLFMLDEVSLAEDAVLERLNSVFEPARTITLPEKGEDSLVPIKAAPSFRVMATMNPAGDFGKKELSPALRNRMTEIHVTSLSKQPDLVVILRQRLAEHVRHLADVIVDFLNYFQAEQGRQISIRDVMSVCTFASRASDPNGPLETPLSAGVAYAHAVDSILLAGLAIGTGMSETQAAKIRTKSYAFLASQVEGPPATLEEFSAQRFWDASGMQAPVIPATSSKVYSFTAPTTQYNLSAVLRVLWTLDGKACLLEGSPGVGKTTLVQTLGQALGTTVVRFNLSEQTDMSDLVGTFLPDPTAPDSGEPRFRWSDGMLLQAMVNGWWVVLDELNLASQSVLEGLNALLDHRAELFIPELNKVFKPAPGFRVFGCQNPLAQGGGRKGLPKSFLNRFTRVWVTPFVRDDLILITRTLFPEQSEALLTHVVDFVSEIDEVVNVRREMGRAGGPWEFNLRDISRWCTMMRDGLSPWQCCHSLFVLRFRTDGDRRGVAALYEKVFGEAAGERCTAMITERGRITLNGTVVPTLEGEQPAAVPAVRGEVMLPGLPTLVTAIASCLKRTTLALLAGPSGAGKTCAVNMAARLCSAHVDVFPMSSGTDTVDLLGQFQQRGGAFVWQDSLLIKALEQGNWLVLDNANFASPTVLDRLNGLLEPNGDLVLNECGVGSDGHIRVIKPHPQFRLILSMDTRHGEVSRAMRNRGAELFVPPIDAVSTYATSVVLAAHVCAAPPTGGVVAAFAAALRSGGDAQQGEACRLLAAWHCGHLARCFPMKAGEWGRAGARSQAPTMNTLTRCLDLVQLLRRDGARVLTAVGTAVEQVYLRGLPARQADPERAALEELLAEDADGSARRLSPELLVAAFAHPSLSDAGEQAKYYLLRAASMALPPPAEDAEEGVDGEEDAATRVPPVTLARLSAAVHHNLLSGADAAATVRALASTLSPAEGGPLALLASALERTTDDAAAGVTEEAARGAHMSVDVTEVGVAPIPPCANAGAGFARLPFAAAVAAVLRRQGGEAACGSWVHRDRALCAFADLAEATELLQRSGAGSTGAAAERGAWRSAAGAAGALARLVPMTATDADVLGWLHCYLRLTRACSKLPADAAMSAALQAFDAKVVQHFSLVGDLRSPWLWKKGGHPSPCPAEHHDALREAAEHRVALAAAPVGATEGQPVWRYVGTSWAVRCLSNLFEAQCSRAEVGGRGRWAALARVGSGSCGVLPADCLPLKLLAEREGFSTDLEHPAVHALLGRISFVDGLRGDDAGDGDGEQGDGEDADAVMEAAQDRLCRHLLYSPCQDIVRLADSLMQVPASDLLNASAVSMKRIGDAMSACLVLPRWDGAFSVAASVARSSVLLLAGTVKPFLAAANVDEAAAAPVADALGALVADPADAEALAVLAAACEPEGAALGPLALHGYCADAVAALQRAAAAAPKDSARSAVNLGCALALLGAWRLTLLQPTSPLDPAMRAKCKAVAAGRWAELRSGALAEVSSVETLLGGDENDEDAGGAVVRVLEAHCGVLRADHEKCREKAVHRRSETAHDAHDKFPSLFWEARQFVTTVGSLARLQLMCRRLAAAADADSKDVAIREATIVTKATESFSASLEKYVGYEDVTAPLQSSAALMQLGLVFATRAVPVVGTEAKQEAATADGKKKMTGKKRKAEAPPADCPYEKDGVAAGDAAAVAASDGTATTSAHMRQLIPHVLCLPSVPLPTDLTATLRGLVKNIFSPDASEKDHWGCVKATVDSLRVFQDRASLAFAASTKGAVAAHGLAGAQRTALSDCETVYGAWVALWDAIEMEEERRIELSMQEVKYKEKKTEIEGDDEALERTMNELFPSYTDAFEVKQKKKRIGGGIDGEDEYESSSEAPEDVDDDTIAYDIRRMRDTLLAKGELLDVVLQYVCMVSDASKLRFTHESGESVAATRPRVTSKRSRAQRGSGRVDKARLALLASTEQLDDDALPEVPAPDVAVASELLDAPSTEIVRKRLQAACLKGRLSSSTIAAALSLTSAVDETAATGQPTAHMLLSDPKHLPSLMASMLGVKAVNELAVGASVHHDVTDKIRTGFNIYKEPEMLEATHGLHAIAPLLARVDGLLAEFPDHPPLLNLRIIVGRVLEMNPRSDPLMKILQGSEAVLKAAHEWETTAHKGVSVAQHIKAIGSAVLRWRRLELHCWPHLLHARRREKEENACRHAFTLWGLVQHALAHDGGDDPAGLHGSVNAFVCDTSYAEFDLRVRLLAAHGQRLALAIADGGAVDTPRCRTLCNLFLNTAAYYGTFLKEFQATVAVEGKQIRKKLAEFIKIQKWEDANYYALHASTQKSHKEIAKVTRLWDALLSKTMVPWLGRQEERLDERLCLPDEGGVVPPPLINKQKGLRRKKKKAKAAAAKAAAAAAGEPAPEMEPEEESDDEVPLSPFNIAVSDARRCLTEEAASDSKAVTGLLEMAETATTMCDTIVTRVTALMPPATEKKTVKQRALKTLLDTLREHGLESRADVDKFWSEAGTFEETSYSIELSLSAEGKCVWPAENGARERLLWTAAERDFYRTAMSMRRLGRTYTDPHGDINEAQLMRLRLSMNQLFKGVQKQRSDTVPAAAAHLSALNAVFAAADAGKTQTLSAEAARLEAGLDEVRDVCAAALRHASPLGGVVAPGAGLAVANADLSLGAEDAEARSAVQAVSEACASAAGALAGARRRSGGGGGGSDVGVRAAAIELRTRAEAVSKTTPFGMAAGVALTAAQHCQAYLRSAAGAARRAAPSADAKAHAAAAQAACEATLLMQQAAGEEKEKAADADADEEEGALDTIAACNVLCGGVAGELSEHTAALLKVAEALGRAGAGGGSSLKDSLPWEALADAQQAAEQLFRVHVQYHCTQARLCLLLSRLFGTLLKKGFCGKDSEEESDDGSGDATGEFKDGVGMDDGEGQKDVSQEIDNEDQVMNSKDLEEQEQKEKNKEDGDDEEEEDKGVDVTTNFEAEMEDVKNKKDEDEDEDEDADSEPSKEEGQVDGDDQEETKGEQHQDDNDNLRDADGDDKHEKMDDDEFTDQEDEQEKDEENKSDGGWDNEKLDEKMDEDDKGSQEGELTAKQMDGDDDEDQGSEESRSGEEDKKEGEEEDGDEVGDDEKGEAASDDAGDGKSEDAASQEAHEDDAAERSQDGDGDDDENEGEANPQADGADVDSDEEAEEAEGADLPDQQKGADQGIDDGRAGEDQTANREEDKQPQSKQGEDEQAPVEQMQDSSTGETMTAASKGARSQTNKQADRKEDDKKEEKTDGGQEENPEPQQLDKNRPKKEAAADPYKALGQLLEKMKEKMLRAEDTAGDGDDDGERDDVADAEADEFEIAPKNADVEQYGAAPVKEEDDMERVEEEDFTKDADDEEKKDDAAAKADDEGVDSDDETARKEADVEDDDKDASKSNKKGPKKGKKKGPMTTEEEEEDAVCCGRGRGTRTTRATQTHTTRPFFTHADGGWRGGGGGGRGCRDAAWRGHVERDRAGGDAARTRARAASPPASRAVEDGPPEGRLQDGQATQHEEGHRLHCEPVPQGQDLDAQDQAVVA